MTEIELKQLATKYVDAKRKSDKFKKEAEKLNTEIKDAMDLLDTDEVELDDGSKVVCIIKHSESFDEAKLIATLKKYAPDTQCIKQREYVDMEVLESEMYKHDFSEETLVAMDNCRIIKDTPSLNIKKAKKGT